MKHPEYGRVVVYPEFEEFNRDFVWSHCLRICHRPQGPNQFVLCRFNPEGVCDRPLGELFDDVEFELIGFRVEKGSEEPRPPSADKLWVSQQYVLYDIQYLYQYSDRLQFEVTITSTSATSFRIHNFNRRDHPVTYIDCADNSSYTQNTLQHTISSVAIV